MSPETPVDATESMSLSEHESTFVHPESPAPETAESDTVPEPVVTDTAQPETDQERIERERDEQGRFSKTKHRAKSQHATPADVPRIQALTKKLREAEDRAKALEERLKTPPPAPKVEAPKPFDAKEPQYEDFANEPDQYQAHMRALAAYDRQKETADSQRTQYEETQKREIAARNAQRDEWFKTRHEAHSARMETLFTSNPQAEQIIADADVLMTPTMVAALLASDNSDQIALKLAQDPDLVDDLVVLTDGKQPSSDLVARVQRRMNRGLQVVNTGSTAPAPVVTAPPRPPNPVRTGVMKAADAPPGEDASLSDHERAYGTGRRRR